MGWLRFLLFLWMVLPAHSFGSEGLFPVAYKGRFRPMQAYQDLWLADHGQKDPFLLWDMHFRGHSPWDSTPFFRIRNADVKELLNLNKKYTLFSFDDLQKSFNGSRETNLQIMQLLIPYFFLQQYFDPTNRGRGEKHELRKLSPGLWVTLKGDQLMISATPKEPPFHFLEVNQSIGTIPQLHPKALFKFRPVVDEILDIFGNMQRYTSSNEPDILALPSRHHPGEWYSLRSLKQERAKGNFTIYSDALFEKIRSTYFDLERAVIHQDSQESNILVSQLSQLLIVGYQPIEGSVYQYASGKSLKYPSLWQLRAEYYYAHFPLLRICIALYGVSALLIFLSISRQRFIGWAILGVAFLLHTFILGLRCYILERPPVSNMFETVIYVPWIAVLASFILKPFLRTPMPIIGSSIVCLILLTLIELTHLNTSMENVQAVLDSQFWLIIHVLMVVGSYGLFALCGVLGHFYLISWLFSRCETAVMKSTAQSLLQAMYLGTALLICGTILGGVWAAESWGRFWDWDPKESWAFISSCVYLMGIHAYRFNHIGHFGLSVGAVVGLQAISFTWYGVNYILGTGLHSYGFGTGGETYYYLFLLAETVFLGYVIAQKKRLQAENIS